MRWLFLAFLSFIPAFVYAQCDFKTAEYIEGMANPKTIKSIDIEIPKSSKYARNVFKILITTSKNIPNKLKKKFKARVIVTYDFGMCRYEGKVRQSGDWKDHIWLVNGNPIQSLDVNLKSGNVVGATQFKLLIPATRFGRNEVLGALLLRELGFIAPETFEVKVNVNGVKSLMIFQEKSRKELLERNLRREGPIFEGDESLIWSFHDYSNFELEPLALSRLINDNWFKKGPVSQKIVIKSFYRLQKAYLDYARTNYLGKNSLFVQVNKVEDTLFNDYHRLLLAMNGAHALRPHNRKYYFNAIEDRFEPIYYDGNLTFTSLKLPKRSDFDLLMHGPVSKDLKVRVQKLLSSNSLKTKFINRLKTNASSEAFYKDSMNQVIINLKVRVQKLLSSDKLKTKFISSLKTNASSEAFYNDSINQVLINLDLMNTSQLSDNKINRAPLSKLMDSFFYSDYQEDKKLSQNIIKHIEINGDYANLDFTDDSEKVVSVSDLSKILSKNEFEGERFVIIPHSNSLHEIKEYKELSIGGNILRASDGMGIFIDEQNKKLEFTQTNVTDWALLLGGDYSQWNIKFNGAENNVAQSAVRQRFNEFGLTGCLTLYKTIIDDTQIDVSGGRCEDSLNILLVRGTNFRVIINDAFADALDADFSLLSISNLEIKNAGNDCFDVSGGNYIITSARLQNCTDKGISIGEMSSFEGESIHIEGAGIGVSSKDSSQVRIKFLEAKKVFSCGEGKRKKQEFGGGVLKINEISCTGLLNNDGESLILVGGK
jgi:hypothetical protein